MRTIYLDYNATTPCAPSVVEAMTPYWIERFGNASSDYALGHVSRAAMDDARHHVAQLLGASPSEIVFTSGGTESNNLALLGVMTHVPRGHLIISAIEHPAVVAPANYLRSIGYDVSVAACTPDGVVDLDQLASQLQPDTVLVSVMHANNETGAVQPIAAISRLCRRGGILVHTDASQTIGKLGTKVQELGVDLLTLAGHKFYGPKGIGALYIREGVAVQKVLHGANQELGLSPGTECVPLIVGLGRAARLAAAVDEDHIRQQTSLRERLYCALQAEVGDDLHVHAGKVERLPNTLSVSFPGVSGRELLAAVPEVCASTGAACHSGAQGMSATMAAMGVGPERARGTVRLSVGWTTSQEDVDRAAGLLAEAHRRM